MTPKEKAHELVLKYLKVKTQQMFNGWWHKMTAKQCALIAVEEILNIYQIKNAAFDFYEVRNYWQEVKQEIEKL
jgi:hypothetical protein